jgi:hypothetical protein
VHFGDTKRVALHSSSLIFSFVVPMLIGGGGKGALIGGIAGGAAGSAYEIHKRHKIRRHRVAR